VLSIYALDFAINAGWYLETSGLIYLTKTLQYNGLAEVSSSTLFQFKNNRQVQLGVRSDHYPYFISH